MKRTTLSRAKSAGIRRHISSKALVPGYSVSQPSWYQLVLEKALGHPDERVETVEETVPERTVAGREVDPADAVLDRHVDLGEIGRLEGPARGIGGAERTAARERQESCGQTRDGARERRTCHGITSLGRLPCAGRGRSRGSPQASPFKAASAEQVEKVQIGNADGKSRRSLKAPRKFGLRPEAACGPCSTSRHLSLDAHL